MSRLEKNGWFIAAVSSVTAVLTILLLHGAALWPARGVEQWVVYFFCFAGIWRCISFLGWLIVLIAAPSSKVLNRGPEPGR